MLRLPKRITLKIEFLRGLGLTLFSHKCRRVTWRWTLGGISVPLRISLTIPRINSKLDTIVVPLYRILL